MAISITSLKAKRDQIKSDIESLTNQDTPAIEIAYNRILANACAGASLCNQLYTLDRMLECFPQTASEEGLEVHAELKNTPRTQATNSQMTISISGTVGATVGTYSTGPEWSAGSYTYETSVGGTIGSDGTLEIEIKSKETGSATTLSVDQTVSLTSTISTINNDATVTEIIETAEDEQGLEDWRSDIIRAYAFPPSTGTSSWFYNESLVGGITRCYPYVDEDYLGRVLLYVADDTKTDGTPTTSQLEQVEEVFESLGNDVMWASGTLPNGSKRVEAFASPIDSYTVTITDGVPSLTETVKTLITTAIENYFSQREPYINGLSTSNNGYVSKTNITTVAQTVVNSQTGLSGRFVELEITKDGLSETQDTYTLSKGTRAKCSVVYA